MLESEVLMESKENVWAKFIKAKQNREDNGFISDLEEAYKYCCPRRYNKNLKTGKEVFDSTSIYSVQARVASNHDALFPAFREWIHEEPVSKFNETEQIAIATKIKERKDRAHKAIELSNFHIEIEDVLTDALFSDGALLLFSGTPENPLHFKSVPWDCFYSLNDYDGLPRNNFYVRKMTAHNAKYLWPAADLSEFDIKNDKNELEVVDGYTYDNVSEKYTYSVFIAGKCVMQTEENSSPWIIFNQKRRAVQECGWGMVLDSMSDVKTLNNVHEKLLKCADINTSGIWQAEDDGVINLDNLELTPGTVVPIAPGSQGLRPLLTNIDLNLNQYIMSDLKDNIKKAVQGSALPEFSQGVRTASEYQMREAEMNKTEIPIMLQLAQSSKLLVKRIFEILESPKMITSNMYCEKIIDNQGKEVKTTFISPLIKMKDRMQINEDIRVMAQAAQVFGQAAYDVIDRDEVIKDFFLNNNFDPKRIRDEEEIEQNRNADRQNDIALAQAGVRTQKATPGNLSL